MEKILGWLGNNVLVIAGAVFAFLIALLSGRERSYLDRLTDAVLCSLLSTGIFFGITSAIPTVPQEAAVAVGSFVGFYGVGETKELIRLKLKSLLTREKEEDKDARD